MEELLIMKRIEHDPPQAFQYPTSILRTICTTHTYEEYLCEEDRLQQSSRGHSGEMTLPADSTRDASTWFL